MNKCLLTTAVLAVLAWGPALAQHPPANPHVPTYQGDPYLPLQQPVRPSDQHHHSSTSSLVDPGTIPVHGPPNPHATHSHHLPPDPYDYNHHSTYMDPHPQVHVSTSMPQVSRSDYWLDFEALDANGDGYVTRHEMRTSHPGATSQKALENLAREFHVADANGDGRLERAEIPGWVR